MKTIVSILIVVLSSQVFAQEGMKGEIILILGPDCPISQKYMHRTKELYEKYGRDFTFNAYVPQTFTKEDIATFVADYKIPYDIKLDEHNQMITRLEASVTPEVFLLGKGDDLIYKGAIDNWFYALGKNRRNVTANYLADALDAVLAGEQPSITETKSVGCFIEPHVKK